jgi:hypothetical protein
MKWLFKAVSLHSRWRNRWFSWKKIWMFFLFSSVVWILPMTGWIFGECKSTFVLAMTQLVTPFWLPFHFSYSKKGKKTLKNLHAKADTCIHYNQRIYLWSFCVIFLLCMSFYLPFSTVVGNLRFKGRWSLFSGLVDSCARTETFFGLINGRKFVCAFRKVLGTFN